MDQQHFTTYQHKKGHHLSYDERVRNMDLPGKLRCRPHTAQKRRNKRILGRSIEERQAEIENHEEFGRWESAP